jgi:hypothetical protein
LFSGTRVSTSSWLVLRVQVETSLPTTLLKALIISSSDPDPITGKDVSTWTRNTSQELVDTRVPENNWIDGVYDMILQNQERWHYQEHLIVDVQLLYQLLGIHLKDYPLILYQFSPNSYQIL